MRSGCWRVVCCLLVCLVAGQAHSTTVFAAASLKNALEDIALHFPGELVMSFGGSSMLARQIEYGAPADVFISANSAWMDRLVTRDTILKETRFDWVSNRLVLIGNKQRSYPQHLDEIFAGQEKIAIAMVAAVPAGIYAKAALQHMALWQQVEPQLVQTDNVRAALTLVATAEVSLGLVYASDVGSTDNVQVLKVLPEKSHPKIRYPVAATTHADEQTIAFLQFLRSAEALQIMQRHGFIVINE